MFVQGMSYVRRDLHRQYGGQAQGGISTPSDHNFVMLFTGEQGAQYGYSDGWTDEGLFLYTGEGQIGDMEFLRGNKKVRDHAQNGKDIHLFEYVDRGRVRYIGQMVCSGYRERKAPDRDGNIRRIIVFELIPIEAFRDQAKKDNIFEDRLWQVPLDELRIHAYTQTQMANEPIERVQAIYYRSNAVRTYVIKRSNGYCEACGKEAPFVAETGRPYLEPHHIKRLSDGGPDHPSWVAAVCPNCHCRAHYGIDKEDFNQKLALIIENKERELGPNLYT
jgi:5-methylcytosine-specific restriction protein A